VEPWNPRAKKAVRARTMPTPPVAAPGPVPPLPGQESNAEPVPPQSAAAMMMMNTAPAAAPPASEDESTMMEATPEESGERGRLFVKVMGVKDLDLPLPKSESGGGGGGGGG
jgi:hypothetical protein